MTTNPPEDTGAGEVSEPEEADSSDPSSEETDEAPPLAAAVAERIAGLIDSTAWSAEFGNAKVKVEPDRWVEVIGAVRDHGFDFFSFLSAIDWSNSVAVGEELEETVEERYEVLVRLSSTRSNEGVTLSTDIPKDDARLPTLVGLFGGAAWHEREAAEMFGIQFDGNPNLSKLYLPDAFEGFPLRKSFPLLSREVKPWPGMVDVEDEPSTENTEGEALATSSAPTDPEEEDSANHDGDESS